MLMFQGTPVPPQRAGGVAAAQDGEGERMTDNDVEDVAGV